MAGRERSGPDAARADLFEGRAWVLCPTPASRPEAVALVADLASACGAQPVQLSAGEHDRAVALVSHAPQLLASAMAGQLVDAPHSELELAGQGLRDSVRIAASDPDLWAEIIAGNATAVADVVAGVARDLAEVVVALRAIASSESPDGDLSLNQYADKAAGLAAGERLRGLLAAGRSGHSRIPGKHGTPAVEYAIVPVVIPDEPGALARLFESTGRAGINVEDLAIEHSPGQPVGLVEISVAPESAAHLAAALAEMGWSVH